jgi:5-methylcytosine-specific restriction endonuclease McrA
MNLADVLHVDHRQPVSRGGMHARWNLQLTHKLCNLRKGAKN